MPTKVLIASDRPLFRTALAESLSSRGIEVLAEADEKPEVVALARKLKPHAIVVDLESGATGLPKAIEEIRESSPHTEVLVVSRFDSPVQARTLQEEGGLHAYLGKGATMDMLLGALETLRDPERNRSASIVVSKEAAQITDRELQILLLASRGLSNQQIANALYLSDATVKRHLANMYEKWSVTSRSQLTVKALAEGWINAQDILRSST